MAYMPHSKPHEPQGKLPSTAVPGAREYYPLNQQPIGSLLSTEDFPANKTPPKLFEPLTIRNVTFQNRIWVSPMCQYSSQHGEVTDWHLVHIGQFALRGAGAVCMEASAVTPEGRITPEDNGIWGDNHIPGLTRIVHFAHAQHAKIGIQLSHAGRKASTRSTWIQYDLQNSKNYDSKNETAQVDEGGWPDEVVAPSAIVHHSGYPQPRELSESDIEAIIAAHEAAAIRAQKAGFDYIEIHGAHGYLIHEFVSPLSNKRSDKWGGSFENRIRFPLEIASRLRKIWKGPLLYRVSASDHAEGPEKGRDGTWNSWGIEQTILLAKKLKEVADVDLIDVSSAGNIHDQKIDIGPGYQVPFAEAVKKAVPGVIVSTVGLITDPKQAEEILTSGKADVVIMAREFLRNPNFVIDAATELGAVVQPPSQYHRAFTRMFKA